MGSASLWKQFVVKRKTKTFPFVFRHKKKIIFNSIELSSIQCDYRCYCLAGAATSCHPRLFKTPALFYYIWELSENMRFPSSDCQKTLKTHKTRNRHKLQKALQRAHSYLKPQTNDRWFFRYHDRLTRYMVSSSPSFGQTLNRILPEHSLI